MQEHLGFVQWDSHAQNIMVQQLPEPMQISYDLGDRVVLSPRSTLLIKWLDFSSALLTKTMRPMEARRACAQRAWFNVYLRKALGVMQFLVPCGLHDWLNVLVSMRRYMSAA
jgi:hypothetical protein